MLNVKQGGIGLFGAATLAPQLLRHHFHHRHSRRQPLIKIFEIGTKKIIFFKFKASNVVILK